jgi:hypothetical protein
MFSYCGGERIPGRQDQVQSNMIQQPPIMGKLTGMFKSRHICHDGGARTQAFLEAIDDGRIYIRILAEIICIND